MLAHAKGLDFNSNMFYFDVSLLVLGGFVSNHST